MLRDVPTPAAVLGFLGVVPFIVCAVLIWRVTDPAWVSEAVANAQVAYGTVILSYLGGIRWGLAIGGYGALDEASGASWGRLAWNTLPALIAWGSIFFLPTVWALIALMIAFALTYVSDLWASHHGTAPAWYASLRAPLSFAVILSLAITLYWFPSSETASAFNSLTG